MILKSGRLDIAVDKHYCVKGPRGGGSTVTSEPGDIVNSTL